MAWVRLALVVLAAAGVTWAAGQIAQRAASSAGGRAVVEHAAQPDAVSARGESGAPLAADAGDAAADEATADQAPEAIDGSELPTPEEVEAELERLEKRLEEEEELAEFRPSKPLPADVPIALPSDI